MQNAQILCQRWCMNVKNWGNYSVKLVEGPQQKNRRTNMSPAVFLHGCCDPSNFLLQSFCTSFSHYLCVSRYLTTWSKLFLLRSFRMIVWAHSTLRITQSFPENSLVFALETRPIQRRGGDNVPGEVYDSRQRIVIKSRNMIWYGTHKMQNAYSSIWRNDPFSSWYRSLLSTLFLFFSILLRKMLWYDSIFRKIPMKAKKVDL